MAKDRQICFFVDQDDWEDYHLVASRRGQTLSEFIRRAVTRELDLEAQTMVFD